MRHHSLLAAALSAAGLASAQDLCPLQSLTPASGLARRALASDGARLAVTVADGFDDAVELFERVGPAWRPLGVHLSGGNGTLFGYDLDVEGPSLLVASPIAPGAAGPQGVIRTFTETPAGWVPGPDVRTNHPRALYFGQSFERAGPWLAAHSWWTNLLSSENRVHLFGAPGFSEVAVLDDPHPVPAGQGFSSFGRALAIAPPWLVVGAPRPGSGYAYVWHLDQNGATLVQELAIPSARSADFGHAVAIDGARLVVSDPGAQPALGQTSFGAVHVFDLEPAMQRFVYTATVRGPSSPSVARFGDSLDLAGGTLAATFTIPTSTALPPGEGLAVFDDLATPIQRLRLVVQTSLGPTAPVGRSVLLAVGEALLTDRSMVVGTQSVLVGDIGRFALGPIGALACGGAPNSTGAPATLGLLGCGGAQPLFGTASGLPGSTFCVPLVGTGAALSPVGQGVLCIGAPMRLGAVGSTVAGQALFALAPALTLFAPGDVVRTQLWYRDGATSNLSDALEVEVTR